MMKTPLILFGCILCIVVGLFCVYILNLSSNPSPEKPQPAPDLEISLGPGLSEAEMAALEQKRATALETAVELTTQYFYDEALEVLADPKIQNDVILQKINAIEEIKSSLVNYEDDIKHIFFHSFIVYPEMTFTDKVTPQGGYNAGFSTKEELEKILPQLYERGYILYDLDECYEKVDGKMVRKEILLPPGKQPLILSVDDVAYAYGKGYAQKLILKENNSLVNLVKNPMGVVEEMVDGDVMGVLELFIQEHPDFSYQGHKGTIALTGYQGAFGWSLETTEGQTEIMRIADALRERGWNFASHSYTHNRAGYFSSNSNPTKILYDTNKWQSHVVPYIGSTRIFILPFGYRATGQGLAHILDAGFEIYCTVDNKIINEIYDDYVLMSRIEIGGYSLTYYKALLNEYFFDVDQVFDTVHRPPVI